MSKTKVQSQAPEKTTSQPAVQRQPETPDKPVGPSLVAASTATALPPPNGKPAAARAADLMAPSGGSGTVRRARMMNGMQRTVGNARVSRMVAPSVQTKLTVGAPDDIYEQEADRVADAVMRMPEPRPTRAEIISRQPETTGGSGLCPECETKLQRQMNIERAASRGQMSLQRAIPKVQLCSDCARTLRRQIDIEQPEAEADKSLSVETSPTVTGEAIQRQPKEAEPETAKETEETTSPWGGSDSSISRRSEATSGGSDGQTPEVDSTVESYLNTSSGGGQPLPESSRAFMEPRFGQDFSGVRVHHDSQAAGVAQRLNAQAFTRGQDIYFGKGRYQPGTLQGQRLLGHELAHVVQQEGAQLQRKRTRAKDTAATAQLRAVGRLVQTRASQRLIQRTEKKAIYVPYQIHVEQPMTQQEFQVAAMRQVFGRVLENLEWRNSKESYIPENSPYTLLVSTRLLKEHRGQVSREHGIPVDEGGGVAGAKERAKTFHGGPESDQKSALMEEIDRRYYEAIGEETKIKRHEKGKAELWRMIRDEVLFQHEYIANLPPQVKKLIKFSIRGKELTPTDYDKLFTIAKKIEKMPAGQASDYASKVMASTTALGEFEASLDKYIAEMAKRKQQAEERGKIHTKLIGLEEVYKKYKLYKSLLTSGSMSAVSGPYGGAGAGLGTALAAEKVRKELETQLQAHDFAGVTQFEAFIQKFEQAFEQEAANIAKDLLEKYASKLYRESERYKNPAEVAALHRKLGGVRAQYREFETNAKIWNKYAKAREKAKEQSRIPGQGHLRTRDFTSITPSEAETARKKAEAAKTAAQSQVQGLAGEHPIFQEEGLPLDKRIDKAALAKASESELVGLLQGHIQNRQKDVAEARARIDEKPELIYKMDKLMPTFYVQQGIRPGSIHDMIIQDKMKEDAILKLVKGIAMAVVAVALAVVSFGTATPAIVAAGAAFAGAGLGTYMALEEYQEYTEQKDLADVGLADDPSMVWLVIAVVGAAFDMGAAVKAVKVLAPAAKALNAGGDLAEFTKAVRALEKANEIEAKVARAAERAAAARHSFAEASEELTKAMAGKMYSFPGPLADPDVYKAVVKMARQAIKTKVYDAQKFIDELRLARVKAGFGDLSPEELAKAKQAWGEAKALEAAEGARYQKLLKQIPDATKLDDLIVKAGDAAKLERLLQVFPEVELESIFAKLKDTGRLVTMLDHVGADASAGMIRQWMDKGKFAKMNQFMERLAGGVGEELAETAALSGKSIIIDSNTVIALMKDADPALRGTMQAGEKARVAYIKSLPTDTELRIGNVVVGEVGSGVTKMKGVPIEVARESAEYQKVLNALATKSVGGKKGFADRGLIADAFFAKTKPGVIPRFLTSDPNVVKNLARMATPKIDVVKIGGLPGIVKKYGASGFNITIEGHALTVIPVL